MSLTALLIQGSRLTRTLGTGNSILTNATLLSAEKLEYTYVLNDDGANIGQESEERRPIIRYVGD